MTKVLLVEDQNIIREGLKFLLETQPDFQVVGEASNGQQAIELITSMYFNSQPPDVVLMDVLMPVMDGVSATQHICKQFPRTKIIMLTLFGEGKYVNEALRYGAKGYLLKDTPLAELAEAVRSINKGYTQLSPGILNKLMLEPSMTNSVPSVELPSKLTKLTARERQILRMMAEGASNKEIANTLYLSSGTVRNHVTNILGRLGVSNRTQAVIIALPFLEQL